MSHRLKAFLYPTLHSLLVPFSLAETIPGNSTGILYHTFISTGWKVLDALIPLTSCFVLFIVCWITSGEFNRFWNTWYIHIMTAICVFGWFIWKMLRNDLTMEVIMASTFWFFYFYLMRAGKHNCVIPTSDLVLFWKEFFSASPCRNNFKVKG